MINCHAFYFLIVIKRWINDKRVDLRKFASRILLIVLIVILYILHWTLVMCLQNHNNMDDWTASHFCHSACCKSWDTVNIRPPQTSNFYRKRREIFIYCKKLHACTHGRFLSQETRDFYLLREIAYMRTRAIFVARDLSVTYDLLEKKISKHCTRAIFVARDKKSPVHCCKYQTCLISHFRLLRQKSLVSCDKNCSSAVAFMTLYAVLIVSIDNLSLIY